MSDRSRRDDDFRVFVVGTQHRLLRLADMLTGDRGRAEDLVQHAYVKTYLAWRRVGDPERYARRVIVNANIDWWRRRPWRERLAATVPDQPGLGDHPGDLARREVVLAALSLLTARERRVVVALASVTRVTMMFLGTPASAVVTPVIAYGRAMFGIYAVWLSTHGATSYGSADITALTAYDASGRPIS